MSEPALSFTATDLGIDLTTPAPGAMQHDERLFRLGKVTAATGGPPALITIEGGSQPMRFLDVGATYNVNDLVVWVDQGTDPFVIGKLF